MKKFLTGCLLVYCMTGCRSFYTQGFNTFFWTSTGGEEVYLFIDGENKGAVPYLTSVPVCDDEVSKAECLKVYLPSGSYVVEVRDAAQNILFSEELKLKKRGGSITIAGRTDGKGGKGVRTFKGDCLIEEFADLR